MLSVFKYCIDECFYQQCHNLCRKMEEALIAEVAKYPWLFDSHHRSYKDMMKKKNTWQTIQAALGLPASQGKHILLVFVIS